MLGWAVGSSTKSDEAQGLSSFWKLAAVWQLLVSWPGIPGDTLQCHTKAWSSTHHGLPAVDVGVAHHLSQWLHYKIHVEGSTQSKQI